MLEKKIIQVDEFLIRRKSAVRRRHLEEQSYFDVLFRHNQLSWRRTTDIGNTGKNTGRIVALNMLRFLGCTDALIQKLRETAPYTEKAVYTGIANYALHVSALYNRLGLTSALRIEPVRDSVTMEIDPGNYLLVLPGLITYALRLLQENKRKDPALLQEYFLSKVIGATFRNGQKPRYASFNSFIENCTVSIQNGVKHAFEGYTGLEELVGKELMEEEIPVGEEMAGNAGSSTGAALLPAGEKKSVPNIRKPFSDIRTSNGKPPTDIRFTGIAGYNGLKAYFKDLQEILVKNNVYKRAGVPMPTGFLLYGPPGTGKTTLVYAFANECGWPFYELNIQDTLDKYVGESEKRIARFLRQKGILLLDEFDSLGRKKEDVQKENPYAINLTNVIATELNKYDPERILFAVTNNLGMIDTKIKSRRLGNVILVDYPARSDIKEIISLKLRQAEENSEGYKYTSIDVGQVASKMVAAAEQYNISSDTFRERAHRVGFSGADIEHIVYETIRTKAREMLRGEVMKVPATGDYLRSVQQFDFAARQR